MESILSVYSIEKINIHPRKLTAESALHQDPAPEKNVRGVLDQDLGQDLDQDLGLGVMLLNSGDHSGHWCVGGYFYCIIKYMF